MAGRIGVAAPSKHPGRLEYALLLGIIALAVALRFWRLGDWGFDSDEIFMLRDSIDIRPRNPRPLLYLLNHYLISPFRPLDEFGLRILPALFGVLGIPVFYFVARRLVGSRAALFGAFLLAASGLHVYYSQFARYWTLVFLFSAIYPYALYLGLTQRNRRALILGIVTAVLAVLAHPASVLLLGGLGVWVVATYVKREQMASLWSRKSLYWIAGLAVVLSVAVALWFIPLLQGWFSEHDTPGNTEFLLSIPGRPGIKQAAYLLGFVESLTLPLVLSGALGIYLLWQRDRLLALLFTCVFVAPVTFLVLLSLVAPVSTFYLLPTVPIVFIGAGVFLDRLAGLDWELRPRWLLPAAVVITIVAAGAPTLISQYRDGRRYDFRGAARWLNERLATGDVVFSDQFKVMAHYLPGAQVHALRGDPAPLMHAASTLDQSGDAAAALWIVTPAASHAFRTNPKLGSLNGWIYGNCQLRNIIGVTRVDFRQNLLQIYRCPPAKEESQADSDRLMTRPAAAAD